MAIALEWAVVNLVQGIDEQHDVLRGIPSIHEKGMKGQLLVINDLAKHVLHMIELGLAVAFGIVDEVTDHPVLAALGIHVHATDQANALNETVRVAAILQPYHLDAVREVLVQYGVIEHDIAMGRGLDL